MGAANMVVVSLTLALFLSTLVIAEVHHPDAELSMDDTLASWFGAISSMVLTVLTTPFS
jgi:hypothetical protein